MCVVSAARDVAPARESLFRTAPIPIKNTLLRSDKSGGIAD
jgi:hypothetical protein